MAFGINPEQIAEDMETEIVYNHQEWQQRRSRFLDFSGNPPKPNKIACLLNYLPYREKDQSRLYYK